MKSETPQPAAAQPLKEREWRMFWIVRDDQVLHERGYSCAPMNPDMWWFPRVGYSMSDKHSTFKDREAATVEAVRILEARIKDAETKLARLKGGRQS